MEKEEQLAWERRWAKYAAGAAFAAAALALAAFLYQRSISPAPKNVAQFLVSVHQNSSKYMLDTILSALSTVLIPILLYYLFRATKFRRPIVPQLALILALVAPIAYGGLLIGSTANQISIAHDFVRNEPGASQIHVGDKVDKKKDDQKGSINDHAKDKLSASPGLAGASIAVTFGAAVAFVLICLNAMRAGLLSRFTGSLGMVVGALYIFQQFIPPGLVEVFWLPAVGLMILDRWPQGRGPAWAEGEAIPWPTAQDRREAMETGVPVEELVRKRANAAAARAAGDDELEPSESLASEPDERDEEAAPQVTRAASRPQIASSHPRSKKKKRKRRG